MMFKSLKEKVFVTMCLFSIFPNTFNKINNNILRRCERVQRRAIFIISKNTCPKNEQDVIT